MARVSAMLFEFVDGVFVGVHTAEPPPEEAWRRYCAEVERLRVETQGVLVYTLGGGPSSKQREALRRARHDLTPPNTAVLTNSALVRGIVTSLNWFLGGHSVAAFAPSAVDDALRHIGREAPEQREPLLRALGVLARRLDLSLPGAQDPFATEGRR